jgi:hypothetical protein
MNDQINKIQHPVALSTRLMPILFFEIWLTVTLLSFLWGPWDYSNDNYLQITLYALMGQILLFLGYLSAIRSVPRVFPDLRYWSLCFKNPNRIVSICAVITFIFYVNNIYQLGYSPGQCFSNIINPGKAYNMYQQLPKVALTGWAARITIFISIFRIGFLPISCVFWGQISKKIKIIVLLSFFIQLSYFMIIGTNKVIFETIVVISIFFWIGLYRNKKMNFRDIFRYGLFVLVLFLSFTIYFSYGIYQRIGGWKLHEKRVTAGINTPSTKHFISKTFRDKTDQEEYKELSQYNADMNNLRTLNTDSQNATKNDNLLQNGLSTNETKIKTKPEFVVKIKKNHFIVEKTPKWLSQAIFSITYYSSSGYAALGLALKCPWQWTYGFGHSLSLLIAIERKCPNMHLLDKSFPGQIEKKNGYPLMLYWHTIYPWLASDLSFTGALGVIFLLGRYLCMTWIDSVKQSNFISPVLCFLFFVACFFISCNNQIVQSTTYEFTLIILFFIWFFFSRKN